MQNRQGVQQFHVLKSSVSDPSNHTVQLTSIIGMKSFAELILNVISQGIGCIQYIETNTNCFVIQTIAVSTSGESLLLHGLLAVVFELCRIWIFL